MFHWNIQKYIEEKQLFTLHDKVLVALSGGADSVALLRVLLVLGYHCEAAHCNFHLRGEESDRDERFVNELCKGLGVTLHVTHFDTVAYASRHHVSIEMAAREMRYDWFEQLRKERGMAVIAVAHHRDDSVETFLLNLIRGAGINGLKGISPHNGCIVRPLLEVSRQDILDYLRCLRQGYVTDSTNLQDEYMRNKIRLNILPMLRELNPSVSESIAETSRRLTDVSLIYNKEIEAGNPGRILGNIIQTVDEVLEKHPLCRKNPMGMTIPGLADPEKGVWRSSEFLGVFNLPVGSLFQRRYGVPLKMENDANACAYAECFFGEGRMCKDLME